MFCLYHFQAKIYNMHDTLKVCKHKTITSFIKFCSIASKEWDASPFSSSTFDEYDLSIFWLRDLYG